LVTKDFNKNKISSKKPNIIIANMQYLIYMSETNVNKMKKNLKLCIFDESHNVSGNEIFNFIDNLGDIVNIGFSATPLRNTSVKLLNKILKIYGDTKKLNVISSYDIFDGISAGIILPFKHYFFEFKSCYKNINDENDDESIDSDNISIDNIGLEYNKNVIKDIVMKNIVAKLPYKKIICWCRTKNLAKLWKEWFKTNFKEYKTHISISGCKEEDDTYLDFKKLAPKNDNSDIKSILICVGRCREGSDIEYVDCGIYLDPVKNRSVVVSMQTAGRIMRTDCYNKKSHAIIIEGYLPSEDSNNLLGADLIIGYYQKLLQISEDNNNYIDKLRYLLNNTKYDECNKLIKIKVDDKENHDCILDINMKTHNWSEIKQAIETYTINKINSKTNSYLEDDENIKMVKNKNFCFSSIKKAIIDKENTKIGNYSPLIKYCYSKINNVDKIMSDTIIRIIKGKKETNGYKYYTDMNISIQGVDAKHAILEIIRQCNKNNIRFDIDIELDDKSIINLKN
jgi:hypothetical protein